MRIAAYIALILTLVWGCRRTASEAPLPTGPTPYELSIPAGFSAPEIPDDNPLTYEAIALGKRLFYDPQLSGDHSVSCASCHQPERAFADSEPIAIGMGGALGVRNSPSLANVAYQKALFAEGGVPSLELQVLAPLIEEHEMNMDFDELIVRLEADEQYTLLFQRAFNTPPTLGGMAKALASFQRTLISGDSRFDKYFYRGDESVLSASEIRGMDLFFSESTGCSNCHSGFLFTDQGFQNIGLYSEYADPGRMRLTGDPADAGKFKVPSLRNIALTAPYMHNGTLNTLLEVVEHFNNGGAGHQNQNEWVQPLNLNEQERLDLVSFLETLTDEKFVNNPEFQ